MDKRKKKILIGVIAVTVIAFAAFIAGMIFLMSTVFSDRDPITAEEFRVEMYERGFEVQDRNDDLNQVNIEYALIANKDEKQIEFYQFANERNAIQFFNENKLKFEASKGSRHAESSRNFANHARYSLRANDLFSVVSRIENTVIYLVVAASDREAVNDILRELGY